MYVKDKILTVFILKLHWTFGTSVPLKTYKCGMKYEKRSANLEWEITDQDQAVEEHFLTQSPIQWLFIFNSTKE